LLAFDLFSAGTTIQMKDVGVRNQLAKKWQWRSFLKWLDNKLSNP